ncbi:MAG TPA: gamma-glutamyltransferase [candidate division Zixibacteria bacterium]|nr:gamma-glutamyltransferase [candidate division Zixibacteria bacterium]
MSIERAFRVVVLLVLFWSSAVGAAAGRSGFGGLVVSDHELATKAGMEVLGRGGNAVDAAVATAFALGVVDPASSGIGGGGFMVIYDARDRKAHALDFRETAPEAARPELYVRGGKAVPSLSVTGALAVAVPGEVAGLAQALKRFGTMPLAALMAPSIRYASEGFPLDAALRYAIERQAENMKRFPDLARLFLGNNGAPPEGARIRQPELAESLKAIASGGPGVFYEGWIAEAIVEAVRKEGGVLSLADLKRYKPVWREPLLGKYRGRTVIAMPPPSSGGVAILQMLNVLEGYRLGAIPHNSATYLHLLAETMKHAFADRAQFLGDPDFVKVPVAALISKAHAGWIRGRISAVKTHPAAHYGSGRARAELGGTTHFNVLDRLGNAVACTLTINTRFGSKVLAGRAGFVLNNEIDDFAIHPGGNVYGLVGNGANALAPGKRPLSSMSPTIVMRGERPEVIVGGAGGPRIISATLQALLNIIDFGMTAREAVEAPRIHHQWVPEDLQVEAAVAPETKKALERRGHRLRERNVLGVVQAIVARSGKVSGAADPRKDERARSE